MGRGSGVDKSKFDRFIDESYFSFVFFNWFLGLTIVGVALIIIGAVVGSVLPAKQNAAFNNAQFLANDPNSFVYTSWAKYTETNTYNFQSVNTSATSASAFTCSVAGPFIYALTVTRSSVAFSTDNTQVSYQITKAKTFDAADSTTQTVVTAINPQYAKLVKSMNGEVSIFTSLASLSSINLTQGVQHLFSDTVPMLIAAEGVSVAAQKDYNQVLPNMFNDFFSTPLQTAVSNYGYKYLNNQLNLYYVDNGAAAGIPASTQFGIFGNLNSRYSSVTACQPSGPNPLTLMESIAQGFPTVQAGACQSYMYNHSLAPALVGSTLSTAQVTAIFSNFSSPQGLELFWNSVDTTQGYCGNTALGTATFGITLAQLNYICNTYIPLWYNDVIHQVVAAGPAGAPLTKELLGPYKFCMGDITPVSLGQPDAFFLPATIPSSLTNINLATPTLSPYLTKGSFQLKYQSGSFAQSDCQSTITYFTNLGGAYSLYQATGPVSIPGSTLTVAQAQSYLSNFSGLLQAYFTHVLINKSPSAYTGYTLSLLPVLQSQTASVGTTPLTAQQVGYLQDPTIIRTLAMFFWPSLGVNYPAASAPNSFTKTIGLSNSNKVIGNARVYDPVMAAQGLVGLLLNLNIDGTGNPWSAYKLNSNQYSALQQWMWINMYNWGNNSPAGSYASVGYQQFATGTVIPSLSSNNGYLCSTSGSNRLTPSCSVSTYFFGLTQSFYPELALAVYLGPYNLGAVPIVPTDVNNPQFTGLGSTGAQTLLQALSNPAAIVAGNNAIQQKYLYYIWNTLLLSQFPGSGLFPTRSYADFILGFQDSIVSAFAGTTTVSSTYAIDPDGSNGNTWTILTGSNVLANSYVFAALNGSAQLSGYWNQPLAIQGLYNPDQLPAGYLNTLNPTTSSPASVNMLDVDMLRSWTWTFNGTKVVSSGISGFAGFVDPAQWKKNAAFNMTADYLQPIRPGLQEYYGPCSVAPAGVACGFSAAPENTIIVDPNSGQVLSYQQCHVRYVSGYSGVFSVTQPNLSLNPGAPTDFKLSSVQRTTNRTLNTLAVNAINGQYTSSSNAGRTVLIVLVILGCLFIVGGIIFLGFYLYKKSRENKASADRELVEDPFKEKSDRFGNTGF